MTMIFEDEKPSLDDLAHHGIKGMKWGVRRGSLQDRVKGAADDQFQRRITTAHEIRTGNAKLRDVVRTVPTQPLGFVPSKKLAARRERILTDRQARVAEGHAKIGDVLSVVGHTRMKDLVISRRDVRGINP